MKHPFNFQSTRAVCSPGVAHVCALGVVAALLSGCAAIPDQNPAPAVLEIPLSWSGEAYALTSGATELSQWWTRFDDPALTQLVIASQGVNTSVVSAYALLRQANAQSEIAIAALSPKINGAASAQRNRGGDIGPSNSFQTGVSGDWAPDLFGAKQRAIDASKANIQIQAAKLGGMQGAVAAAVTLNYIVLRSAQERLGIAKSNLASQLETLQITRWRNQAGLIGAVEVEQADVAVGQVRAQMPILVAGVENAMHALAVQTGKPPAALQSALQVALRVPTSNSDFGPGRPKDALSQRADVRAARFAVIQASAQVEQALAQRYPVFDLSGNVGLAATTVQGLAQGGATVLGLALGFVAPLWDGGAASAGVRVQQAILAQAQASFLATELLALQEVEDAMALLRAETARSEQLRRVVASATNAARLARQRYASGLVDFQIVLETQRTQFASQDALALSGAAVSSDQVRLYTALGGGWHVDPLLTTATKATSL